MDTSNPEFRKKYGDMVASKNNELLDMMKRLEIEMIDISTSEDWFKPLMKFFNRRTAR